MEALQILKYKFNQNEDISVYKTNIKNETNNVAYDHKMRDYEQEIISLKDRVSQLELQI